MLSFLNFGSIVSRTTAAFHSSTKPGARVRISQTGLNYAAKVTLEILSASLMKLSIPDQEGTAEIPIGKIKYQISNIRITNFLPPSTNAVTINPGSGMTWSVTNAAISLHGDWRYKYGWGILSVKDSGDFDGVVSDVSISVTVTLAVDAEGRPIVVSTGCTSKVENMHLTVHGGANWFYKFLIDHVVQALHGDLERLICHFAREVIDVDANRELATLPQQVIIDHEWILNYRLVQPLLFSRDYIESAHKGEIFHEQQQTESSLEADILPNPSTTSGMVTIWLSDYIINSAASCLYKLGLLQYYLTVDDLPHDSRGYLDTKCRHTLICIGGFIPSVGVRYPDASIELEMIASDVPMVTITTTDIQGTFVANMSYHARLTDGSLAYLFKTSVKIEATLTVKLVGTTVQSKVHKMSPTISVVDTAVGPISTTALTHIFDLAAKVFIIPTMNKIGKKGFPLPMIEHIKLINPKLSYCLHALRLTTDVEYAVDVDK